jgi:ankyrin repeat protein
MYSGLFLVNNNISVNIQSYKDKKTALMYLASFENINDEMLNLAKQIIRSNSVDINTQDTEGNTALHITIKSRNKHLFKEIIFNQNCKPDLNIKNKHDHSVLWLALIQSEELGIHYNHLL